MIGFGFGGMLCFFWLLVGVSEEYFCFRFFLFYEDMTRERDKTVHYP